MDGMESPAGPPARRKRRPPPNRRAVWFLLAAAVLAVAFAINGASAPRLLYPRAVREVEALPPARPFRAGERVLVVSPHPDDETLCCSGSVQRAVAAGAQVSIVWFTSGDGFEIDAALVDRSLRPGRAGMLKLGERRIGEARRAAGVLGVPSENLTFLGYPDGGLLRLFLENYAVPYASRYTGRTRVPYRAARSFGAPYTGENVERDLDAVLDRVRPDVVLAPSPQDQHPDHRAVSYFVTRALARRGEADRLRFWIVHGGLEWPIPKGLHENLPLMLPPRGRGLEWRRVDLTPGEEAVKLAAVRAHRSQVAALGRFMYAFVRDNELLADDGLAEPPGLDVPTTESPTPSTELTPPAGP